MAENYELAYADYKAGMKQKEIAAKYDVTINTVKSWQQRKWKKLDEQGADEKVCTPKKSMHTKKSSAGTKKKAVDKEESLVIENSDLTDKQWLFCLYYTKYWNATKAYQKAYDSTYETARAEGSRNLAKPSIREEIERMKGELTRDVMIDGRVVLQKYIDIAFSDMGDYTTFGVEEEIEYDEDGFPKVDANGNPVKFAYSYVRLKDSRNVDTSLITEVKKGKDGVSVKLADKMKALDFLAKNTDLLNENELKQLKMERERIAIAKETGATDEYEDDGFLDALKGVKVDWSDD